jgi:plastocyanin
MQWYHRRAMLAASIALSGFISLSAPVVAQSVQPTQVAAAETKVEIENFDFTPMALQVAVGTKVTWTNHDDDPHTVVSVDTPVAFKSPPLDTDDSFSFTFTKPGTYKYFCSVHPKMVATVVVK